MALRTFFGGIRLYDGKDLSRDVPIRTLLPDPGPMAFPLKQHKGKPSVPVVRTGEYVRTGQLIAKADGDFSANLHSSVSGRVLGVYPVKDVYGEDTPAVLIDNDDLYLEIPYPANRRLELLTRETVLSVIRYAGIVGMGGAGVPTHFKLMDKDTGIIDTVIANCVECEPYLTSDYRRLSEDPWKVINGLMVLLTVYPGATGYIAVSENNEEGYYQLREILKDNSRIYVKRVSSRFPQGSERQLIYTLTGRSFNASMLPSQVGCMVLNTDTLVAVNQAVIMHEPLITRIMTVTGEAAAHPANFRVRIGMTYRTLLEEAGGLKEGLTLDDVLLLEGGPMTGQEIRDLDAPVTKLSSALVCLRKKDVPAEEESVCIRCGRCADVCPLNLLPVTLCRDIRKNRDKAFVKHFGLECCDCSCCSYVCPARIPLGAMISEKKAEIMKDPALAGEYVTRSAT